MYITILEEEKNDILAYNIMYKSILYTTLPTKAEWRKR